jgi:hypothetical protein
MGPLHLFHDPLDALRSKYEYPILKAHKDQYREPSLNVTACSRAP